MSRMRSYGLPCSLARSSARALGLYLSGAAAAAPCMTAVVVVVVFFAAEESTRVFPGLLKNCGNRNILGRERG